jgi:CheY-like chemotaxis protein
MMAEAGKTTKHARELEQHASPPSPTCREYRVSRPRRPPGEPLPLRELPNPEKAKPCVMVVDDDDAIGSAIAARLGRDFRVVGEIDPREAVNTALREQPDIILCDINMPEMKGDEVAFLLSEDDGTTHIPLIYLTALVDATDPEALDGRFGDHPAISKSASTGELKALIYQVLGLSDE